MEEGGGPSDRKMASGWPLPLFAAYILSTRGTHTGAKLWDEVGNGQ